MSPGEPGRTGNGQAAYHRDGDGRSDNTALDGDRAMLRQLVREVLAEVLPGLQRPVSPASPAQPPPHAAGGEPLVMGSLPQAPPTSVPAGPATDARVAASTTASTGPAGSAWTVRVSTDAELHDLVLRVLRLADNPKVRRDLISGRARFRLAAQSDDAMAAAVHRVEKGAVTERAVAAAARVGARLVLGPRAVLTPLAKDSARALGVPIEKEH
jgi:hypothetical protein